MWSLARSGEAEVGVVVHDEVIEAETVNGMVRENRGVRGGPGAYID